MEIIQFEDKKLAHYSYAIISNGRVALIDPARDPQPYYDFATQHNAQITAVIETHPHADFVSSHLEIHNTTGATLFASALLEAGYEHQAFDEDDMIALGDITLRSINTPGHSPDSISIVAMDENGIEKAVFTGDTLFIGDCGRPDLREKAGAITAAREVLAKQMYHSLRDKLMTLPDDVIVYPAHGAGSLCGKGLSTNNSSTIGAEKLSNWCLQKMSESEFVKELLSDQPFVPKYFPYDVDINKKGATSFSESISKVKIEDPATCDCIDSIDPSITIVDTRHKDLFKKGHMKSAINVMKGTKFETWLGSIINPGEKFYLIAEDEKDVNDLIKRTAKIGYENQIVIAFSSGFGNSVMEDFDSNELKNNESKFTIVDIRNQSEVNSNRIFPDSIHIPLHELRERTNEIPTNKPIVVHCAGGYRSGVGSSIIEAALNNSTEVFDLGEEIKKFTK